MELIYLTVDQLTSFTSKIMTATLKTTIIQEPSSAVANMTLDATGNMSFFTSDLGLTTGPVTKFTNSCQWIGIVSTASTTALNNFSMYSTTAAAYRFYVDWGGTIHATSTSITAISDRSLKTNIRPLETGLVEIMKLQPRRFDWINGDASNVAGFIAQEVEEVLPELVTDQMYSESETKKALKMGDILPTLVSAIQQQQAIIASLTDRIAILEAK
jgi:hypothetical protein